MSRLGSKSGFCGVRKLRSWLKPTRTWLTIEDERTRVYSPIALRVATPKPPQLPNLSVPVLRNDSNGPFSTMKNRPLRWSAAVA
jgi:hypothetical protein